MTKKKMEYEFCMACPHVDRIYRTGGGLLLICRITGKKLEIDKCPVE